MRADEIESAFENRWRACPADGGGAGAADDAWLRALTARIRPADAQARAAARSHWAAVAKPLGALGLLEDAVCTLAAAQGTPHPVSAPRALAVFFADNGVVAEGISQSGQEVTLTAAHNICGGTASVSCMARVADCAVVPVDVGMAEPVDDARMHVCAPMRGTADIALGPACPRDTVLRAIGVGAHVAGLLADAGARVLAAGEMGIGNTTTSAAVASALTGAAPELTVGRGAGLTSEGLARKRAVVERALRVNQVDACADAVDVLAAVGGLDIAAMCGLYLGAAAHGCPAVLDGVISCTAALAAVRVAPELSGYLVASHCSSEPAARLLLDELRLCAPLQAGMHLGEGTGAMALLPLLDMALAVYDEAASFDACGMDAYRELS
ncbi:nicotinate-nucleotide--dimethylbenzimidazole phosphoribosyltransferase [Collinsella ihumii]|uniref:Nicotinate-nucleotide--dimethylbenzimidazole phosphoribosyltransferase n=1 Tax=Collinsella ihumii TaxID=1720204 RepID=A0AAW7JZB5_9ACTN|nr:nicotinate-nucleotide--dimethylbenzimidazole phosphoribosyltransferase [Collinsella ihumii]MDN0069845.1 nicotinate-nucleotide--dimethylbenzimidazole phosphoribosyltransferase [Collinsella ihumii]